MSRPSLHSDLRSLPRAYWVLVAGTFVNRFGSFVYPFLTLFLTGRNFSRIKIGAVVAGYGGGAVIAGLAGGWFADRFGRRHTIVAGTLANAGCVFALYFATSTPALAVLTLLAGLSSGFYQPASSALVADLVPAETRLPAYAVLRLAANAGFAFGTATGGFLVSHSTFWLFAGDGLTTATFGVIALLLLPHGQRTAHREARWSEALVHIRGNRRFLALYAAQLLTSLVFAQSVSSYALEVTGRNLHAWALEPAQIYGLLIGWNGTMIVMFELLLTRVTRRYNPGRVMGLGCALIGLGFASNAVSAGFPGLFAGMTLFTLGEMLSIPMINTWVSHVAPANMRGRYMGALGSAWSTANMVGPALGLMVFGYSPEVLWLGCGLLGLAGASILVLRGGGPAEA
ncbi:MAG: MFS transporter [Pseudomonadota bacterium]